MRSGPIIVDDLLIKCGVLIIFVETTCCNDGNFEIYKTKIRLPPTKIFYISCYSVNMILFEYILLFLLFYFSLFFLLLTLFRLKFSSSSIYILFFEVLPENVKNLSPRSAISFGKY